MLTLPAIVFGALAAAVVAPWTLGRLNPRLLVLVPLAALGALIYITGEVTSADLITHQISWVGSLGVNLSFRIDAFSLLFCWLITGIGALVVFYSASYFSDNPRVKYFTFLILSFMAAMIGAVLSDDVIIFFIFWELTSVISFLLIGFDSTKPEARRAATQSLMITAGGGLALLAGLLLLAQAAGSTQFTVIVGEGARIAELPIYPFALILILAGAFTKSAQLPFQFWLANAMAAPTPASAYLHSATMVKLGIFLLIVLDPAFGSTAIWQTLLIGFGAGTMMVAAGQALRVEGFKSVLAQTTVAALGTLTLLVGLDTPVAAVATVGFFLSHALYKAALFFVAGNAMHATGISSLREMGGLYRALPLTAAAAVVASLSMAGLPPFIGFIAKELLFEAKLAGGLTALVAIALIVNSVLVALAAVVSLRPFYKGPQKPAQLRHRERISLVTPPLILAGMGALLGIIPGLASSVILVDAASAVAGQPVDTKFKLWHGLTPMLGLSVVAVASGALLAWKWRPSHAALSRVETPLLFQTERLSDGLGSLTLALARWVTGMLQHGSLRRYTLVPVAVMLAVLCFAIARNGIAVPELTFNRPYIIGLTIIIILGSGLAALTKSFLAVLIGVGLVGYALGVFFLKNGAPDLAFTQFAVETVFVVIASAIILRLPLTVGDARTKSEKVIDGTLSIAVGGAATVMMLAVLASPLDERVSDYYRLVSLAEAYGRNVVNVIIVDFRALDTLGEIGVVALAALGAFGLMRGLKIRSRKTMS